MRCAEKWKYLDKASADAAVDRTLRSQAKYDDARARAVRERLQSYKCPDCTFWHVGKSSLPVHSGRS